MSAPGGTIVLDMVCFHGSADGLGAETLRLGPRQLDELLLSARLPLPPSALFRRRLPALRATFLDDGGRVSVLLLTPPNVCPLARGFLGLRGRCEAPPCGLAQGALSPGRRRRLDWLIVSLLVCRRRPYSLLCIPLPQPESAPLCSSRCRR